MTISIMWFALLKYCDLRKRFKCDKKTRRVLFLVESIQYPNTSIKMHCFRYMPHEMWITTSHTDNTRLCLLSLPKRRKEKKMPTCSCYKILLCLFFFLPQIVNTTYWGHTRTKGCQGMKPTHMVFKPVQKQFESKHVQIFRIEFKLKLSFE